MTDHRIPAPGVLKALRFDCPWTGHEIDPKFALRNSNAPNVIGFRCLKCHCLLYEMMELAQQVDPAGDPLPSA